MSITLNDAPPPADNILIGRAKNDAITLNIDAAGAITFRTAVSGFVPIGSYAEFQLINTDAATLGDSYCFGQRHRLRRSTGESQQSGGECF